MVIKKIFFTKFLFAINICLFGQQDVSEKLEILEQKLYEKNLNNSELLNYYQELSALCNYYPIKSAEYSKKGIILSEMCNKNELIPVFYNDLAWSYYNQSYYDSSLICCEKVIQLYMTANETIRHTLLADAFRIKGIVYTMKGSYKDGLNYFHQSLKAAESSSDKALISNVYGSIAYLYSTINNHEQAENYLLKMKQISSEIFDTLKLAYSIYQLSNIYINKNEVEKALQYAQEGYNLVMSFTETNPYYVINALTVLSSAWSYFDKFKALEYAKEALLLAEKHNISILKSGILHGIARLYNETGDYVSAEQSALYALEIDSTNTYIKGNLYDYIIQSNIRLGRVEKAITYFELYRTWTAEFSQETFQTSLSEMEIKYETEKKELLIANLEYEKRLMILFGIAAISILMLAATTLLFLWRWKVQKHYLSEQQIKQLEQKNRLIATQALLDGEVQERTRIARDLHDGIGSILTVAKMNLTESKKSELNEKSDLKFFNKTDNLLDKAILEMRHIAHHLMPESLSIYGLKHTIKDFCDTIPITKFNYYGDESRLSPKLEVMIYRITHELVSNAIKHANASNIFVEIVRYDNKISLTVQDDGCGFDTSCDYKGMGLKNVRTRVAAYNGHILIDSKNEIGTEVNIELSTDI